MNAKKLAGVATLFDSLWSLYLVSVYQVNYWRSIPFCTAFTCPPLPNDAIITALLVVGLILLADSGACIAGVWLGFPIGGLLSVATIPLVSLRWNAIGGAYVVLAIVLAVAALVLDGVAILSRTKLSEQSHPLNLPVFG